MKTQSSSNYIPNLVKRGYDIHQQLIILDEEFRKIKDQLKDEAVARPREPKAFWKAYLGKKETNK
jgi:hypothetical protein